MIAKREQSATVKRLAARELDEIGRRLAEISDEEQLWSLLQLLNIATPDESRGGDFGE